MNSVTSFIDHFILQLAYGLVAIWKPAGLLFLCFYGFKKFYRYMNWAGSIQIIFDKNEVVINNLNSGKVTSYPSRISIKELKKLESKEWRIPKEIKKLESINGIQHDRCPINDSLISGKTFEAYLNRNINKLIFLRPNIILTPKGFSKESLAVFEKVELLKVGKMSGAANTALYFGESFESKSQMNESDEDRWFPVKIK